MQSYHFRFKQSVVFQWNENILNEEFLYVLSFTTARTPLLLIYLFIYCLLKSQLTCWVTSLQTEERPLALLALRVSRQRSLLASVRLKMASFHFSCLKSILNGRRILGQQLVSLQPFEDAVPRLPAFPRGPGVIPTTAPSTECFSFLWILRRFFPYHRFSAVWLLCSWM